MSDIRVSAALPASLEEFARGLAVALDPHKMPSVAFGIAKGVETLLLGAHGYADPSKRIAATPQTPYSLASITKPLTTTALMMLAHDGRLDIARPINDYLRGAKLIGRAGASQEATVRRVADHSSGLHTYYRFYYADEPTPRRPMDEVIERYAKLMAPPGERHCYSNLGYGLLDSAIENVSGQSYESFMAQSVFAPLGMTHASIGPPIAGGEAVSIGLDGTAYPHYTFDHPGGSAAYASVEDLLAFGRFQLGLNSQLLPRGAIDDMHRRTSHIDTVRGYGLGWGINEDRFGYRIVSHTGMMGGVSTVLRLVPSLELVVVVLTNGQSDVPFRAADDAMAALLPEFRARLEEERSKPPDEAKLDLVPGSLGGSWSGHVETHNGEVPFAVEFHPGHLATATLDGRQDEVESLQFKNGRVLGVFNGDVGTDDASAKPYRIHLDLMPEGERLHGAALTLSTNPNGDGGTPGKRYGSALPYWCELHR